MRRVLLVLLLGCRGVPPPLATEVSPPPPAESLLARVAHARATLALGLGDPEEAVRQAEWVVRLAPSSADARAGAARTWLELGRLDRAEAALAGAEPAPSVQVARLRLAVRRGEPGAVAGLSAWAHGQPELWPEVAAHGGEEGLDRWLAASVPDWQRLARGRAAWEAGRAEAAAQDLGAAMAWVPAPHTLALWAEAAAASCRAGAPWRWVARWDARTLGPTWEAAVAAVDAAVAVPCGPAGVPPVPSCDRLEEVERLHDRAPLEATTLHALGLAAAACGDARLARASLRAAVAVTSGEQRGEALRALGELERDRR